jgi:hypothetical protein
MMTAPAGVISYLATVPAGGKIAVRADLYTLTLADATVLRWTSSDVNITIGGNTWLSNGAVLRRTNIRKTSHLEVDNLQIELSALVSVSGKTIGLMSLQRAFSGARMKLDHLIGPDLSSALGFGPILAWYEGRVASTRLSQNVVTMTVESDVGALDKQMLPRSVIQPGCAWAVYDPNCKLNKATFTDAGTASGTLSTTQVQSTTAAIIAKAAGFYELGVLKFTSGVQVNQRRSVKTFSVSGGTATITLSLPLVAAPANADTFSMYPGCDLKKATCKDKFANLVNFRGMPHVPASDAAR